jgi:hypothetical protein
VDDVPLSPKADDFGLGQEPEEKRSGEPRLKAPRCEVHTSSSCQPSGDPRLNFGLGATHVTARGTVHWPDGTTRIYERLAAGRYHRLVR